MLPILTTSPEPKEISWKHHIPMWAYPQLRYLQKRFPGQFIITRAYRDEYDPENPLIVRAHIKDTEQFVVFRIYKQHMHSPEFVPRMFEI